ncbi:LacI family DNA-binding transcriptional regulator [Lactobacillus mulieris]|jgi:transcriptional regulator-family|uniref:LacI family transcriptional regulator n=2 Tax=Lactobacillus mulieris TaxID=2508708 RepID=A0AAP3GY70_9LACO|nr:MULTISPECIES: LacI family DNA-binding transcriptional regulator [Lactobacillus]EEU20763.1 hypothetical protein HMPREF0525_00799 [Lactobacillus jensenii 27-2-CHN]EEX23702.1 transcriptional regulator, LacI family [Lactobacillus jensenii 115-3-CHN]EFH30098.1 transcriptional regulator, LacI family [Lactobacillus jensenii JV-V16]KAA9244259.1 LacI family transcriptional regulator [Lactobacillus jensenii]KAA9366406.1 LacI family transcriptional regulator [Lactobacillus jensenii]
MVTLSDVAKEANVSKMTVSRAINHPEQVTPELLALVEKAMTKLDYHPNSIARALVNNRTNVIKFVTLEDIDTTEPYYMNLLFGVARGLKADSYAIQLVTDIDQIQKGNADGYIITGARECNYPIFDELKKPFIFFGETSSSFDFVDTDNRYGTAVATKYALARGYKNAVFIGIDVKEGFEYAREYGYLASMQECNLEPQIFRTGNHSHLAEKLIDEQIERIKPNTCFICASDRLAIGVCRALARLNKKMPEDYGVIGFDGVFLDQVANPQLTTVKQQIFKIGDMLAQLILEKIKQSGSAQGQTYVKPELIVRGTTR